LLIGSAIFNFSLGQMMMSSALTRRGRTVFLWAGLAFNIFLLSYFKYTGFILTNWNLAFHTELVYPDIILPLAISFFTFQKIAYLVDVYLGRVKAHSFIDFLLFVFFFPQLIAGPIVHHSEVMPQYRAQNSYRLDYTNFAVGIAMFAIGLFKKIGLADSLADYTVSPFLAANLGWQLTFFQAWAAVISFSYQIYFDFSGYSDMALGLALMFNVRLPVNFSSPYKATSIIDLWRRWHMTLTRFLTDYIYTPLSLRLMRRAAARRVGKWARFMMAIAVPLNMTFLVSGIWHGAGWNYVLFGVINGIALTINSFWRAAKWWTPPRPICWMLTMFAFALSIACFRSESLAGSLIMVRGMIGLNGFMLPAGARLHLGPVGDLLARMGVQFDNIVLAYLKLPQVFVWLVCLTIGLLVLPNAQDLLKRFKPALDYRPKDLIATTILGMPIERLYGARAVALVKPVRWIAGIALGVAIAFAVLYPPYLHDQMPEFIYFKF
ncbi:MAG TPA: MBOAT family O-acyltransferase, partial [Stellaceae bacterium]|nr:MBOAT family O-acyltransferase [Stellaceae bacterium]